MTWLAALPLALLTGCGGGSATPTASPAPGAGAGGGANTEPWVRVEPGKAVSSAPVYFTGSPPAGLPPVSYLPTPSPTCQSWPLQEAVLIPMQLTVGAGSIAVSWPNRFGNLYRVTAVPQDLVTGAQPDPVWKTVSTGTECTASTTITGLTPGRAYIVWLDAPNTPRKRDGSRDLYSGKSGIVIPN